MLVISLSLSLYHVKVIVCCTVLEDRGLQCCVCWLKFELTTTVVKARIKISCKVKYILNFEVSH